MCGRFAQSYELNSLEERFKALVHKQATIRARYNVAPGQPATVIVENNHKPKVDFFQWGLVPSWSSDPSIGYKMINAREETVWEKQTYRNAVRYRRCLVPVSGFYEWVRTGSSSKQAVYFQRADRRTAALAGLWEVRTDREGGELYSFTILTAAASPWMRRFHDRMPVVLADEAETRWLDHGLYQPAELEPLIDSTYRVPLLAHPVSDRVNRVAHNDPACAEPVGAAYGDSENPVTRGGISAEHPQRELRL